MRVASAGKYARAFVRVAGARDRAEESVRALDRASEFFASGEGRAAAGLLHSSRVPASERRGLLDEIGTALSLNEETRAVVDAFVRHRALGSLGALAARSRLLAAEATGLAEVELRTARPLTEEIKGRIARAAEKLLARPVRLNVVEDEGLLAGVVMRAGDRIWDGTLAGALARAGEALGRRT